MSEQRTAVFPGSFDPVTIGHEDIILRALPQFDKIVVAIGVNSEKQYMHTFEERMNHLKKTFADYPNISIDSYSGLTVDYCKKIGARFLLRGLRNTTDFEYERNIANMNHAIQPQVETVFLMSSPQYIAVSSSIVREIMRHGGPAQQFLPEKLRSE